MDNEQLPDLAEQSSQVSVTSSIQKSRNPKRLIISIAVLVLALGIGSGSTYALLQKTVYNSQTDQAQTAKSAATFQSGKQGIVTTSGATWHTVLFGSINGAPNIAIKLAFPQAYQAIAYDNGPDGFRSLFGDDKGSSTYHGGDWEIGNPNIGDGLEWGNIQIMGIANDWYGRNGYASYGGFNGDSIATTGPAGATINGYNFYTAKQKNDSLKSLMSNTSNCAKDPAKGFTLSGVFNVCYKPFMIKQSYAAYDPQVMLSGYASIKGVPYVLFGEVRVEGGLDGYSAAEVDKAGNDFQAGKIPASTQKNIDLFIEAFKQSTVTSK